MRLTELRYLDLRVPLSDATLCDSLGRMKQLKNLVCDGHGISAEAREKLQALLPECDITWLAIRDDDE